MCHDFNILINFIYQGRNNSGEGGGEIFLSSVMGSWGPILFPQTWNAFTLWLNHTRYFYMTKVKSEVSGKFF